LYGISFPFLFLFLSLKRQDWVCFFLSKLTIYLSFKSFSNTFLFETAFLTTNCLVFVLFSWRAILSVKSLSQFPSWNPEQTIDMYDTLRDKRMKDRNKHIINVVLGLVLYPLDSQWCSKMYVCCCRVINSWRGLSQDSRKQGLNCDLHLKEALLWENRIPRQEIIGRRVVSCRCHPTKNVLSCHLIPTFFLVVMTAGGCTTILLRTCSYSSCSVTSSLKSCVFTLFPSDLISTETVSSYCVHSWKDHITCHFSVSILCEFFFL